MDKPDFLLEPEVWTNKSRGTVYHSYSMPEDGEDILAATQWMMSFYDEVYCDYGVEYDTPYCNLEGKVRDG